MVIVMKADATDGDIEAVAEKVRAAGERRSSRAAPCTRSSGWSATPTGSRRSRSTDAGRRSRDPGRQALQDGLARPAPRDDDREGGHGAGRPRRVHDHRRARARSSPRNRRSPPCAPRRPPAPRSCAATSTSRGRRPTRSRGSANAGSRSWGRPARYGPAVHRRGRRRLAGGARGRGRRLHPRRHAQRAELRAPEGGRADGQARDAEAWARHDDRGMAAGGRVRGAARQLRDHPVRARHPDLRALDPQHARPRRHGGRAGGDRTCPSSSIRRTPWASTTWWRRWRWPRSRPAPTA